MLSVGRAALPRSWRSRRALAQSRTVMKALAALPWFLVAAEFDNKAQPPAVQCDPLAVLGIDTAIASPEHNLHLSPTLECQ